MSAISAGFRTAFVLTTTLSAPARIGPHTIQTGDLAAYRERYETPARQTVDGLDEIVEMIFVAGNLQHHDLVNRPAIEKIDGGKRVADRVGAFELSRLDDLPLIDKQIGDGRRFTMDP